MLTAKGISQAATVTLTEAVTMLAFDDPVTVKEIETVIAGGRWGTVRQPILDQLDAAAQAICEMGITGKIECLGSKAPGLTGNEVRPYGPIVTLKREDFLTYTQYVPAHDALWRKGGEDANPDDYSNTFSRLASEDCFGNVVILREAFATAFSRSSSASPARFTDAEIDAWISCTAHTAVKNARGAFMKEPRAKGLSATFERRWNDIKQNPVGRPPSQ